MNRKTDWESRRRAYEQALAPLFKRRREGPELAQARDIEGLGSAEAQGEVATRGSGVATLGVMSAFVPVRILEDAATASEWVAEVEVRGGRLIRVATGFDGAELARLVGVLESC